MIDEALLRRLLADQMPELAEQPLEYFEAGWDNVSYRLGTHHLLRMPRRKEAAPLIESEQRWLPELEKRLPIPVPAPIAVGQPAHGYPWAWSLVPFLPGRPADIDPPAADQAERFSRFLVALHRPAPADAPTNPYRGVPLADRAEATGERIARLRASTNAIRPEIDRAWRAGLDEPTPTDALWLHGDLHAGNVLVDEGSFTGIIDWGDMTSGDPATDLASTWMLFEDPRARRRLLDDYGVTDAMRNRARGWAVFFGVVLLDSGLVDDPQHAAIGEATLRRITEDG